MRGRPCNHVCDEPELASKRRQIIARVCKSGMRLHKHITDAREPQQGFTIPCNSLRGTWQALAATCPKLAEQILCWPNPSCTTCLAEVGSTNYLQHNICAARKSTTTKSFVPSIEKVSARVPQGDAIIPESVNDLTRHLRLLATFLAQGSASKLLGH